jgi:hypothetical protein
MRKKIPPFPKLAFSIFIAIFTLCFISLSGSNGFLKPSIAEAANSAIGFTRDNPGIRMAIEVQGRHTERLMGIPGVVGHGVGISSDGEPVIKIFATRAGIPGIAAALEGVPTKVEVTGMIVAYADPTARFPRPVPIGVSTGHPDITAGTIGCRVTDANGNVYALSNNHIYANENEANIGDSALQPGPYDGGNVDNDEIGTLFDYEPIYFAGEDNFIDAAIALSSVDLLGCSTPGDGYGTPSTTTIEETLGEDEDILGLKVQKYGRTTGWTHGTVDTINTTVDVCYETTGFIFPRCVKEARFRDQIGITPGTFSAGGDSGSLIVTEVGNNPVGLLFAGNNTHTFANQIGLVLDSFTVTVDSGGPIAPLTDIAVTEVNAPSSVVVGDQVDVYVTVQNTGNQDVVGSFDVVLKDLTDSLVIGTQTVSSLAAGSSTTLTFPWDTSTASSGDHTLEGRHDLTDDDASNDSSTAVVTVNEAGTITLTATGKQNNKWLIINLDWSGANSANVDIYRDGAIIATTSNDGAYTDKISNPGGVSLTYQVCEADSSICSNEATVTF